jgi:protein AroM
VCVVAASPYTADAADRDQAIEALRDWGADLVVLDCLGFDRSMKARAAAIAGVPMILPRTVLARTLAELAAA